MNKYFKKVLNIFLIVLGVFYGYLIIDILASEGYMPCHEDETINYNSGRIFYETNSLKATYCFNENVSPVLGSNWYGFFYNVFYGGIAKVFGFSSKLFIVINVCLLILGFYFITKINISKEKKIYFAVVLFLIPNTFYFLFSYWPVVINMALALSLILILYKILERSNENSDNVKQLKVIYLFLCFIYIIVNPLWAIWSLGLLPFSKSKKGLISNCFAGLVIILSSFAYIKYFCAPWITGNTSIMFFYLFKFEVGNFIHLLKENFLENLHYFYKQNVIFFNEGKYDNVINQCLLAVLLLFSPIYYLFKRNKLYLSVSLISIVIFIILITIYTPEFEYFQRILTPIYILLLFSVFITDLNRMKAAILILLLIVFPFSIVNSLSNVDKRKQIYLDEREKYSSFVSDLNTVKSYLDVENPAVIQWVYFEHDLPKAIFFSHLPLSDARKQPITYTIKIKCFKPLDCDGIEDENKFERFGRLKVNYAISKNKLSLPGYEFLAEMKNFSLYKIQNIK